MRVLSLAPHPDDEVLGAGATNLAIARAGHELTVLCLTLGRRDDRERRRAELTRSAEALGVAVEALEPALRASAGEGDDLEAAQARLETELTARMADAELVIAPSPDDGHPAHELVGRAALRAAAAQARPPRVWLWALWSTLRRPTLLLPFDGDVLGRLERALAAHGSQLARNDYSKLLRARAEVAAVTGPELVCGFGGDLPRPRYAELLCELIRDGDRWLPGSPRRLEPDAAAYW